ncbi:MAG: TCP-1/cpn60 chaperonin family protein, partial [Coriobacteriaceae bacterium]|nr:TCP-1/cpn60 chaperonin family protein [Coriobacteriaceae bacterium]
MTAKHILYSDDARAGLAAGIHKMAEAVKVTLGPKGRYVALEKKFGRGTPVFTNDGVTVAKGILTENQVENMGLLLIREAAIRTNDIAGDGTTTATLLADVLVTEGLRLVEAGAEALPLRRGMEKAVDAAVKAIEEQTIQIEGRDQVARVAFISSGDDTVGNTIAEAVEAVGSTGGISCADGSSFGVEVEIVEGIRYDRGFVVPAMITDEEHHFGELENPLVLVTDHEIKDVRPIIPMLERVVQSKRDLFIISNDLRGEALHTIMLNTTRGTFRTIATEMPDYVEEHNKNLLADIALACGATPYFK